MAEVIPGGTDDVNGRRDDLLEGLAVSVAILLRQSAPKAADGLAGLAGDFKAARQIARRDPRGDRGGIRAGLDSC